MATGRLEHRGQIVTNLLDARPGHQGNDGPRRVQLVLTAELLSVGQLRQSLGNLLHGGVAHIGGMVVALGIPLGFEGQDAVHVVDISLDVAHSPLLPHPHLGRDEVVHTDAQLVGMTRNLEVERRIVDEHHMVGSPVVDGTPGCAHEAQDGRQVLSHLDKAHISHVAVVDDGCHTRSLLHQVTTQKLELRIVVALPDCLDQVRAMQVARCFTGYEKVFHYCRS